MFKKREGVCELSIIKRGTGQRRVELPAKCAICLLKMRYLLLENLLLLGILLGRRPIVGEFVS